MNTFDSIDGLEQYLLSFLNIIDVTPLCKQIEKLIKTSIEINFRQGGSYGSGKFGGGNNKWTESKRAIAQKGKTLQNTGSMKSNVGVKVNYVNGEFQIILSAGKVYSAVHNFGHNFKGNYTIKESKRTITQAFGKKIKSKSITIGSHTRSVDYKLEARPFLVIQDVDIEDINDLVLKYLVENI